MCDPGYRGEECHEPACPPGYYGTNCEQFDICDTLSCGSHGRCVAQDSPDGSPAAACVCSSGWIGATCAQRDLAVAPLTTVTDPLVRDDDLEDQAIVIAVVAAVGSLAVAFGLLLACKACNKESTPERRRRLESQVRLTGAVDNESQESDWLSSLLTKSRLKQHISAFREARCEELADIKAMGRETMSSLGLTSLEAKRLQRYVVEDSADGAVVLATATALGGSEGKEGAAKGGKEAAQPVSVGLVCANAADVEAGVSPCL